jgi:hypothetical protein
MKTLTKGSFLLLAASLSLATVRAQTADEIVNKYIDAQGGKAVISGIKSLYTENTIEVMGTQLNNSISIINGKAFKSEADFNGVKIIQVVTDKSGWIINPPAGQTSVVELTADQVKAGQGQLQIGGPLVDYAAKGYKIELIGKDTAGGGEFKIKMTGLPGLEATYFINGKTWLLDKEVDKVNVGGQDAEITRTFSDYKKTDAGLVTSNSMQVVQPQYTLVMTTTKTEVNKTIDPAIFDMPK